VKLISCELISELSLIVITTRRGQKKKKKKKNKRKEKRNGESRTFDVGGAFGILRLRQ